MSHILINFYDEFLKSERENAVKFFKEVGLWGKGFNIEDYHSLVPILLNIGLVSKMCDVIDKVVKKEGMDPSIRFIVLGDFLFSIMDYNRNNPTSFIYKISRGEYISKIMLRANVNMVLGHDFFKYIHLHKVLLVGFRKEGIVERNFIRRFDKRGWETRTYFRFNVDIDHKKMYLGYSRFPFVVVKINGWRNSVSSFRNISVVKRKKREMENVSIPYRGIERANGIGFILCKNLLSINSSDIEKEKNKLLSASKSNSIEEYFKKIIGILKDKDYIDTLIKEEGIEDVSEEDLVDSKLEIINEYRYIIKNFQKILSIYILNRNIFNEVIYLSSFIDNRGRQYYSGLVSPTFYKLFRYLYKFSNDRDFVGLEESIYYSKIISYKNLVNKYKLDDRLSYILLVLFIELGKFFIKNNHCIIRTEFIIETGILKYDQRDLNLDFDDLLYVNKIYYLIDNLINNRKIDTNTLIFKDATASGLQNYGIVLGYKESKLEYLNLIGNNWCDTYQYIIDKFLEKRIPYLLKRKYWKGTIMTIPYNAVWYGCFIKFLDSLRADGIDYNKLDENEKMEIREIHKKFYNDLRKYLKSEFYKNISGNLKEFKYYKWLIVNRNEYKINYQKNRDKYVDTLYMLIYDELSTETANEANNMHYLDSELIREISDSLEILSIHDCFGVRLNELHLLMDRVNAYYSKKIGFDVYCTHVLI